MPETPPSRRQRPSDPWLLMRTPHTRNSPGRRRDSGGSCGQKRRRPAMSTLRHGVHSRLDPVAYRQLRQEAAARGVSLAACIADCLREYSALRAEMASAVTVPGTLGEPQTGLVHSLLSRTEQRLLATLEAHASELGD